MQDEGRLSGGTPIVRATSSHAQRHVYARAAMRAH